MHQRRKDIRSTSDQSARFIEAAKKAEAELSGKAFEKAFKKIVRVKPSARPSHQAAKKS
jgi:hypothetical protein